MSGKWHLLHLSSPVKLKVKNNGFISKCFFKIKLLMIRKNRAHSHDYRDIVELVADCGAKEISSHLLTAPKNTEYS